MTQNKLLRTLVDRLEEGLPSRPDDGCWLWTGAMTETSPGRVYGRIVLSVRGKKVSFYVHRLAYRRWIGPIPEGATVSQSCGSTLCCRPEHLVSG